MWRRRSESNAEQTVGIILCLFPVYFFLPYLFPILVTLAIISNWKELMEWDKAGNPIDDGTKGALIGGAWLGFLYLMFSIT